MDLHYHRKTRRHRMAWRENVKNQAVFRLAVRGVRERIDVRRIGIRRFRLRVVARWSDLRRVVDFAGAEVVACFDRTGRLPSEGT